MHAPSRLRSAYSCTLCPWIARGNHEREARPVILDKCASRHRPTLYPPTFTSTHVFHLIHLNPRPLSGSLSRRASNSGRVACGSGQETASHPRSVNDISVATIQPSIVLDTIPTTPSTLFLGPPGEQATLLLKVEGSPWIGFRSVLKIRRRSGESGGRGKRTFVFVGGTVAS